MAYFDEKFSSILKDPPHLKIFLKLVRKLTEHLYDKLQHFMTNLYQIDMFLKGEKKTQNLCIKTNKQNHIII